MSVASELQLGVGEFAGVRGSGEELIFLLVESGVPSPFLPQSN